jgi:hypothetical protein
MNTATLPSFRPGFALPARDADQLPRHVRRMRVDLLDGASTTLYVATYPLARTELRVVRLAKPQPLQAWCQTRGIDEAMVGGFYARPHGTPLGELRTSGVLRRHVPFDAPWASVRACLHVEGGQVRIGRRHELPEMPAGDLLQAGPLLVRDGLTVDGDAEGFSAGQRQFDSDITSGRYPRAALGIAAGKLLAVVCDGRADHDAGLTMGELAETLLALGAHSAINLDGGGSASLVAEGRLHNCPREEHGVELPGGRAVTTALVFRPTA